ncbi:alpha-N-acetylgalactosamine-specific lectin-like [Patiria miniata]|uniref:C-type lectin domain-containing protein n=1 Tax=Patiria miniata TaxID=46514 RepID=A0A913ZR39_PATMI|nr:alpha-N-acetylgalactosamine-specific lectin-like [Patiria miniata]
MAFSRISCVMFFLVLGLVSADDCPPFWTGYGNYCYRFFGPPKTWQSAEEHCREFFTRNGQGHLASIHSAGENDFLIQLWRTSLVPNDEYTLANHAWIGHNDLVREGRFTWSDGTGFDYSGWSSAKPADNAGSGEDCGDFLNRPLLDQVVWNDYTCNSAEPYICKMTAN